MPYGVATSERASYCQTLYEHIFCDLLLIITKRSGMKCPPKERKTFGVYIMQYTIRRDIDFPKRSITSL